MRTNIIIIIALIIVTTILTASEVMANYYCYQEHANVPVLSCGPLVGTGTYLNQLGQYPSQAIDGNWNSWSSSSSSSQFQYLFINYTKPANALNNSLWQVKDMGGTRNLTIDSACWNAYADKIRLAVASDASSNLDVYYLCHNLTHWNTIYFDGTYSYIYEEAMYWSFNYSSPNITMVNYSLHVLEYTNQTFNLSINDTVGDIVNITANFTYNGTTYTTTSTKNNTTWNLTRTIMIPAVSATHNETRTFYWTYSVDYVNGMKVTYNTSTFNQTVYRTIINNASAAPVTISTIRFDCRDEVTNATVNCTLSTIFDVWAPQNYPNPLYRKFTFLNTPTTTHTFFKYPNGSVSNFTSNTRIQYWASGYPSRMLIWNNLSLNDTLRIMNIPLLSAGEGIYVTFMVINPMQVPIQGAYIEMIQVDTSQRVCSGTTGPSGTVTCWQNPNRQHNLTINAAGYPSANFQDWFTQPIYTITLGNESSINMTPPKYYGVDYNITPLIGTLNANTSYNFSFSINSTYWGLSSFGFNLQDSNGTTHCSSSDTSGNSSGTVWCNNIYTGSNSSFRMEAWFNNSAADVYYIYYNWRITPRYQGNFSIATFFDDLRAFVNTRKGGISDFTLMIIAFTIILIITGILSWMSGIYSPIAIGGCITALTWLFYWVGMIPRLAYPAVADFIPWFITVLWIAFAIWDVTR